MTLLAQITDLHLRPRGLPALRVSETNLFAERAVTFLSKLDPRPDGVIITGDVADTGDPKEYETAIAILDQLPMPYWAIPGNHDSAAAMKAAFAGRDWAGQMPGDSLQFAIDLGELRLIGIDTSVPGKPYGGLEPEQLEWIDTALSDAPDTPTVVALHHPPLPTGIGHMDRTMLRDAQSLEAVLSKYGNIVRVICGHQHRMISGQFARAPLLVAPGVAHQIVFDLRDNGPSAFNFEPPAAMLHAWTDGRLISHMAYIESFPGPYPFWPDKDVTWPGY